MPPRMRMAQASMPGTAKFQACLFGLLYRSLQPDEAAKIYVTIIRLSIYKEEGIENG